MGTAWMDRDWVAANVRGANSRSLAYEPGSGLYYRGEEPFTGVALSSSPDGLLSGVSHFRAGPEDGVTVGWYGGGRIRVYNEMREGVCHGWHVEWRTDGGLKAENPCEYGRPLSGRRDFSLHFGTLKVGTVTQTDGDFPDAGGTIPNEPWVSRPRSPVQERFARFIDLNKGSTRRATPDDSAREQAAVEAELEAEFSDHLESEEWRMLGGRGLELPIHCPVFGDGGVPCWRWDPGRGFARLT